MNWSPGRLSNGHMIILGGSGAGKTETVRCIALELAAQALPVIMIDFHGDMAPNVDDIRAYKIREGGEYYFNPLEPTPSMRSPAPRHVGFRRCDIHQLPDARDQQRRKIKNIIRVVTGTRDHRKDRNLDTGARLR